MNIKKINKLEMIVIHKQSPKYLLLKLVLQETMAFCFQKSHIANLKKNFERSLQVSFCSCSPEDDETEPERRKLNYASLPI